MRIQVHFTSCGPRLSGGHPRAQSCPFSSSCPGVPRACPVHLLKMACLALSPPDPHYDVPLAHFWISRTWHCARKGGGTHWYLPSASPFQVLAQGHVSSSQAVATGLDGSPGLVPHCSHPPEIQPQYCCSARHLNTEHHSRSS